MATRITVEHLGVQSTGETVAKAKQAAAIIAEAVVAHADIGPMVVIVGKCAAILWRTKNGWSGRYICDESGPRAGGTWHDPGTDSAEIAMKTRLHFAQQLWDGVSDEPHPDAQLDKYHMSEWRGWVRFQRALRGRPRPGHVRP